MKTTSKVKNVQGNGSFESQYGEEQPDGKKLLFSFDYLFEDGVSLKANHKTNISPFPEGSEVEYEVTRESEKYGKSGKVTKPDSYIQQRGNGGERGYASEDNLKGIKIGHAITNAVSLCIAQMGDRVNCEKDTQYKIHNFANMILKIGQDLNNQVRPIEEAKQKLRQDNVEESDDGVPF